MHYLGNCASPKRLYSRHRSTLKTLIISCVAFSLMLAGCNRSQGKYKVQGVITLDGKPLSDGMILLKSVKGSGSEAAPIQAGEYQLEAAPGSYQVMVTSAYRVHHPERAGQRDEYTFVSIVPARYNERTTLKVEVAAEASNRRDFELASQK